MKKKLLNLLLVILLLVSIPGSLILASDISGALYRMSIVVSNNGTLANYVSTNGVISTPNLIAGGFLNASANNCAVLDAADNDVPFMPGYLTNPWAFWVETIGADSYINYDLYTADTTGGTIAYFPDITGMIVADNDTLELGNSFDIELLGWIDTTVSANKSLLRKVNAFELFTGAVAEEVTATIIGAGATATLETTAGAETPHGVNHNILMPAGVVSGDLLIVCFGADGNDALGLPGGWTQLDQQANGVACIFGIWYRVSDGTEGASIVGTTAGAQRGAYTSFRLSGYSSVPEISAVATATSANPDPPNLAPSWGAANNLWLATSVSEHNNDITAYPAGYGDTRQDGGIDVDAVCLGTAWDAVAAAAENPGPFTLDGAEEWICFTVAIPPAALEVTATGITSGEHIVTTSLNSNAFDFSLYSGNTTVAVNMGGGLIPVFLLEEQELTAPAASVTFANIDTLVANWDTYAGVTSRHLVVMANAASDDAAADDRLDMRFNGDSGNNYNYQYLRGTGNVPAANVGTGINFLYLGHIPAATTVDSFGGGTILIPHAFNTVNHKSLISLNGSVEVRAQSAIGRWADTSAITSVTVTPFNGDYISGSTLWLGVVDERYLVEEDLLAADGLINFAGIPQDGSDLAVIMYARSAVAAASDAFEHEINGDGAGASYFRQRLRGDGNAAPTSGSFNDNILGEIIGDTGTANAFAAGLIHYSQYAEGTNDPHVLSTAGFHNAIIPRGMLEVHSARRNNVAAITSLDYNCGGVNFLAGSLFSLYRVPRTVIDRQELTAPQATITFNNIPQGYEALQLLVYTQSDDVGATDTILVSYNNLPVAANYNFQYVEGTGAGPPTAARNLASMNLMRVPASGAGANIWGGGIVTLPNYAKADRFKHYFNVSGAADAEVYLWSSSWANTDAITEIDLTLLSTDNFDTGSVFELVGIFPQDVFAIEVDGDLYGIADGNNVSVPDNANDWDYLLNDAMPYMYSANQSGQAPHFTGAANSKIDVGAIHNNENKLWVSLWFKLDTDWGSTAPAERYLWGKRVDGANQIFLSLRTNGVLRFFHQTGGVGFALQTAQNSWEADKWYNVIASISDTAGARLITAESGGTQVVVTDADTTAVGIAANMYIGDRRAVAEGVPSVICNVAIGTDDLTTDEEVALFNGVIPSDANNIWYADEGTGVNIVDYGTDGDDGTAGVAVTWVGSGSLIRASWEWEYAATFNDPIAGSTDATPSFRTASSDADVVATAVSFQPIEEAKAPPWSLTEAVATWITAANIAGNFTTTPSPTYPGASVIEDISAASGTPAQLPFIIIFGFLTLAISFCVSYVLRRHGSRSLLVKVIIIGGLMGIWRAVGVFDFWMIVFFLIMGIAIMAASKPGEAI